MDFTWSQSGVAAVLLFATGFSVVAYLTYLALGSERRMRRMVRRAGLDPAIVDEKDMQVVIREIRSVCRNCQAEDVCERWLAGEVSGENVFCPNRKVFERLAKAARTA